MNGKTECIHGSFRLNLTLHPHGCLYKTLHPLTITALLTSTFSHVEPFSPLIIFCVFQITDKPQLEKDRYIE